MSRIVQGVAITGFRRMFGGASVGQEHQWLLADCERDPERQGPIGMR
jgi:hypothetical protein